MARQAYSVRAESFIEAGSRKQEAGSRKQEAGSRKQEAFGLAHAAPAAGAFIGFSRFDGPRARPAANTRIALIVQWIVGDVLVDDAFPDVFLGPVRERADLHQAEFL